MSNFTQQIIDILPPIEAAKKYLGAPSNKSSYNSSWYCCCFHNEDAPSLQIFHKCGKGFYCRGCNTGGSVVLFVQKLFQISNRQACEMLDNDFQLGIIKNYTPETLKAKQDRENAIKLAAKQAQDERKHFIALCDEKHLIEAEYAKIVPPTKIFDKNYKTVDYIPLPVDFYNSINCDRAIAIQQRRVEIEKILGVK